MDTFSLFCANLIILLVFSASFFAIAGKCADQPCWRTWALANRVLAVALGLFALGPHLPLVTVFLVPNVLLLLGFGLHWNAACQFSGRATSLTRLWAPVAVLAVVNIPAMIMGTYSLVYVTTNLLLIVLAGMTALSYAAKDLGGLMSRYGLMFAFALMAAEAVIRTVHGLTLGNAMGARLTDDFVLTAHLLASLVFATLAGTFALGVSFERTAKLHQDIASRDPLTGVYNRREFERRLEAMLAARAPTDFGVLQFDIDHFKRVNDQYGHGAGDDALIAVATVIRDNLRDGDCFARLGGEEFGVLLPKVSRDSALKIAERIRCLVETLKLDFTTDGFNLTLSAGVYHGTGARLNRKDLMRIVDQSLYASKNNGRNRVSLAEYAHAA